MSFPPFPNGPARSDPTLAPSVLSNLPAKSKTGASAERDHIQDAHLTPAQRVLNLPDTLDLILSHLPPLSTARRVTLHASTLTSRPLHYASQNLLWSRPRDLNTVEQQVRFAFAVAISSHSGRSLGDLVQRLAMRWVVGGRNGRLIERIATLCPGVREVLIHWGDTMDGIDEITPSSISTLHTVLSSFRNLTHLELCKYSWQNEIGFDPEYPPGSELPFSKLEFLRLDGFTYYWPPIARGLGPTLKTLWIGSNTLLDDGELLGISRKCTSLTTLNIRGYVTIEDLRSFVSHAPDLEEISTSQSDVDGNQDLAAGFIPAVAQLQRLKSISFNGYIDVGRLAVLAGSPCPLEEITIVLAEGSTDGIYESAIRELVMSKSRTLKFLSVEFEASDPTPTITSDALVSAFATCPHLEYICLELDHTPHVTPPAAATVDTLIRNCPRLVGTPWLEELVEGNEVYEKRFRSKEGEEYRYYESEEELGN